MRLFAYRVVTFALGLAWLFLGAGSMSDWDLGVSVLMAVSSAAVMPAFDRALWQRHEYGLAFVVGCFPVSSVYAVYWTNIAGKPEVMVPENFGASWGLFLGCWLVWCLIPRLHKPVHDSCVALFHFFK